MDSFFMYDIPGLLFRIWILISKISQCQVQLISLARINASISWMLFSNHFITAIYLWQSHCMVLLFPKLVEFPDHDSSFFGMAHLIFVGISRFTTGTMASKPFNSLLGYSPQFNCCSNWWLQWGWKANNHCIGKIFQTVISLLLANDK